MMNEKLTLTELQLIIRDSLYMALPDMYWVIAEISEINENYAGHCYLELVEKNAGENNIKSRIKAIIWCKKYRFLKTDFDSKTGESLKPGLKILVRAKIEYHEIYGLSLIICDIDPAFTLGEMALKRQLIIKKLEEDGVIMMNRDLALPWSIQRIAIISSRTAAGYTDLINQLSSNSYKYVFYTCLFESPMQGSETEQGITAALDRIAENINLFDIVVIIRGGGSQIDLSWFDNYNIAYHITQFPIPVLTGIGHEKDISVTDLVAHTSLKTPTAAAGFIIDHMARTESMIMQMFSAIKDQSKLIIEKNRNYIDSAAVRLLPVARIMISASRDRLSSKKIELISIGKQRLSKASLIPVNQQQRLFSGLNSYLKEENSIFKRITENLNSFTSGLILKTATNLDRFEQKLELMKPENVLKRGYTITSINNRIVTNSREIKEDDILDTRFRDGSVISKVLGRKNDPEK